MLSVAQRQGRSADDVRVGSGDKQVTDEWWHSLLPEITRRLRAHLARRLRPGDHDDLVDEALLGLSLWMRNPARPLGLAPGEDGERQVTSAALTILQRRIADRYRLDAREWGRRIDAPDTVVADVPSLDPPADRTVLLRRMLDVTLGVLATLGQEDRDIIALAAAGAKGLDPRERQRLRRARARIANEISEKLGASAVELLRTDEGEGG